MMNLENINTVWFFLVAFVIFAPPIILWIVEQWKDNYAIVIMVVVIYINAGLQCFVNVENINASVWFGLSKDQLLVVVFLLAPFLFPIIPFLKVCWANDSKKFMVMTALLILTGSWAII